MLSSGFVSPQQPADLLTRAAASEDAFKQLAPQRRVVYLATHGFWIQPQCDPPPAKVSMAAPVPAESPLLACGIALAGANLKGADSDSLGMEDGVLTAEEVAALDLTGVDMVVLSACESGIGPVVHGEGVFALRRAFELAGARTVLSSLWRVDDLRTAQVMRAFGSQPDSSIPQAMRRAMLAAREQLRADGVPDHPYFWAGFVSSGEWRTVLQGNR